LEAFPDFTDATSPVLIRNAQEAIVYATAALAGWARGSTLAENWDEAASDALEDLVVQVVRREQQSSRRRRPLSSRRATPRFRRRRICLANTAFFIDRKKCPRYQV
jgi:hypothetical protein